MARWLFGHARDLPVTLGLRGSWWCGLFLSRSLLFNDEARNGDVDFIAGPLKYDLTEEQWESRIRVEERKRRFEPRMPGYAVAAAHMEAGKDGCVAWPPTINYVVAVEAKASHHDLVWKRTHTGARAETLGQLEYLRRQGVNRAAFLHIGAIAPPASDLDSWDVAGRNLSVTERSFPVAFEDEENHGYGYYRALMAAVPGHHEAFAGAHGPLREIRQARLLNPVMEQSWHAHLRARLGAMGRPNYHRTYVLECPSCQAWQFSGSSDPAAQHCVQCKAAMMPPL
jgi:hypothetical protein